SPSTTSSGRSVEVVTREESSQIRLDRDPGRGARVRRRTNHIRRRLILTVHRALKPRRSCLSVPASSARMQTKAASLDADEVLFDLEDATAPSEKAAARSIAVESLKTLDFGRRAVAVRVNSVD